MKSLFPFFITLILFTSCGNNIEYSPEQIQQTSGRYVFNQNEVIDVYYEGNELYLNWKGGKMKPVVLDENTFFVPDMYQKLRFVKHPDTKDRYLAIVSEVDQLTIDYAYPKVADTFKTARMYLRDKEYDNATASYLKLREKDSTQIYIQESELNGMGYAFVRKNDFKNAIAVFKMNVALYPESDNVYDSLADAYKCSGDTVQAIINYKIALELNTGNKRAKDFIKNHSNY